MNSECFTVHWLPVPFLQIAKIAGIEPTSILIRLKVIQCIFHLISIELNNSDCIWFITERFNLKIKTVKPIMILVN